MVTMQHNTLEKDLERFHGFQHFRDGQKESLQSIVSGQDTLSILPTSTGKSLIYFMAAKYYRQKYPTKFTIVCCPLISLMRDQIENTPSYVRSTMLGSGQFDKSTETKIWDNQYDIVYISPERLVRFMCPNIHKFVSLLVVDEAHCVSQDGSTYRPSYLDIGQVRTEYMPNVPILALTATATQQTRKDITCLLALKNARVVHVGMDRPNLRYIFTPRVLNESKKLDQILSYRPPTGRSIIYCATRKECESLSAALSLSGWCAAFYHAGMGIEDRERVLQAFLHTQFSCIVATISFGLGVNIPDIRLVLNVGISRSVSAFSQESGRAGRDGHVSKCVLLYHRNDLRRYLYMIDTQHERVALLAMDNLVHTPGCRRKHLLSFFQPPHTPIYSPSTKCMGCDYCDGVRVDVALQKEPVTTPQRTKRSTHIPTSHKRMLCDAILQTGNFHGVCFPISYLRGSNQKAMKPYIALYKTRDCCVHVKGKTCSVLYWKRVHATMEEDGEILCKYTSSGNRVYSVSI